MVRHLSTQHRKQAKYMIYIGMEVIMELVRKLPHCLTILTGYLEGFRPQLVG